MSYDTTIKLNSKGGHNGFINIVLATASGKWTL
jgi:hypothetical protein